MLLSSGGFAVYRAESSVFNFLEPRFGDLSVRRNKEKLMKAWLQSKLFRRSGLDGQQIEAKVLAECRNGGDFLRIVMEEIARSQNVERWADCTPDHLLYLRRIKQTLPNALVIHIIRDGRDVALSYDRQGWAHPLPGDKQKSLMVAGLFWEWILRQGREDGRRLGADYTEVYFEDLVTRPREVLTRLGSFIDHDLDYDRILEVGIGSVREPNTSFEPQSQAGGFNPLGRWKERFSPQDLANFEGLVGPFLKSLGYALAAPNHESARTFELRRMRAVYFLYFSAKQFLRAHTPLGRFLITRDLSWL